MTYGMTKEQMIAANRELINAVQVKEERIRELEAAIAVYQDAEPIWRKRVAELETELAYFRRNTDRGILRAFDDLKARAEKAEAAFAGLLIDSERLQLRIAELERAIEAMKGVGNADPEVWGANVTALFKAREREE